MSKRVLDDPRQKNVFQTSDLSELFHLHEPIDGSISESDKIFKNLQIVKVKKANVSANFEGEKVDYLMGRRLGKSNDEDNAEIVDDDNYVLNKLFSKTSVISAMGHDTVLSSVNCDEATITPMQRIARETAQESMDFVRQSRKWCYRPAWTS